jgi:hypothetical protein
VSAFHRKNSSARNGSGLSTRDEEMAVREADKRFRRALALAFLRGDHLPADMRDAA